MTTTVFNLKNGEGENKIPNVFDFAKKGILMLKNIGYFTASGYNEFTGEILEMKLNKGIYK